MGWGERGVDCEVGSDDEIPTCTSNSENQAPRLISTSQQYMSSCIRDSVSGLPCKKFSRLKARHWPQILDRNKHPKSKVTSGQGVV